MGARSLAAVGLLAAVGAAAERLLRGRYESWGADLDDVCRAMPGDGLVRSPVRVSTRAVTVHATPALVWPWLAQMGHGRGGLYSYDWLENLIGCDLHSADDVLPDEQDLALGDLVRMGPEGYPCFVVAEVSAGHHLVLQSADPRTGDPTSNVDGAPATTWQWLLEPQEGSTRLVSRQRLSYPRGQAPLWAALMPVTFLMERKMLLGIKSRAEALAAGSPSS